MDLRQSLWVEKYRPSTIQECILPSRIKQNFQDYVNKKEVPNLLLCGLAGTGKTTVARAICDEIGLDYILINGSDESGIDVLRTKIKLYASSMSLSGGRKVIIIDEADYMNANSLQPALRGAVEEFAKNCSFIFTCNYPNRIIKELHSRTAVVEFKWSKKEKPELATKFYQKILDILNIERISFDEKVVSTLVMKYFPDFRRTLNELQRFASSGTIDESVLANLSDVDIKELVQFLKEKDFQKVRQWVNGNSDNDPNRIFRRIYDSLSELLKPQSVPAAILILSRYSYQSAFAADTEINLLACLVELMVDLDYK